MTDWNVKRDLQGNVQKIIEILKDLTITRLNA